MLTRRLFLTRGAQAGLATATAPLWTNMISKRAFAQAPASSYKAIVIITLEGGNDANNMVVPMSSAGYAEYSSIRGCLTLSASALNPLQNPSGTAAYGLHPALTNIASLYNQGRAAVVANVGPLTAPITKQQLLQGTAAGPDSLFSHPDGVKEWESASAYTSSLTGWGGRLADVIMQQSGNLPPVLNEGVASMFTVGNSVQAVAVQSGAAFPALDPNLQGAINKLANCDASSSVALIKQAAYVRQSSLAEQAILTQAMSYKSLKTTFPNDPFGRSMRTTAQLIAGQAITGATRQIFYMQQGQGYDTHANQLPGHEANMQSLDQGLGAFFAALDELGVSDQVLVCTHSDFNRTLTPNTAGGSDHAWGSHQLVLGGGIKGGRILGTMPVMKLFGPDDLNGLGIWVPTTAVVQLTGAIGGWMGLTASQLSYVFPELKNFPAGALQLN